MDKCNGHNDNVDTDVDGTPDGCDQCPNDAFDDADGDGVCGDADICEGYDDYVDADGDGTPDDCDDDDDNDGVLDNNDLDPFDALVCGDSDTDGCDDCSAEEGQDADNDGFCDIGDSDVDGDGIQNVDEDCANDYCNGGGDCTDLSDGTSTCACVAKKKGDQCQYVDCDHEDNPSIYQSGGCCDC